MSALLAVLVIVGLFVCSRAADSYEPNEIIETTPEPSPEIIEVESITILLESHEFQKGTRFWPEVIIQPHNATDKSFELYSDNVQILRQQGNHWIAADVGTTNLMATAANGITGMVSVTVLAPELESLTLFGEEAVMAPGDKITLTPILIPQDAAPGEPILFASDDDSVATVSEEGVITAVDTGIAIIRASVGEIYAELKVTVIIPVRSINVSMNRHIFNVGDQAEFKIEVDPPNASNASISVSFSGASVTSTGTNTFICNAAGEVIITFTAESGSSISHTITVIDLAAFADEVHRLTNIERANAGLAQLGKSSSLTEAAQIRAREALVRLDQEHRRPDGREFFTVLDDSNVEYRFAGENLAAGQRTPAEVVQGWMGSQGHRRNILSADFGHLGVGAAIGDDGRIYWAQLFID